ncbi:ABC-2 transporter permease [Paraliobacillus zengyii]|uniref:ABC-2 transporter permease n=1 Tax=Paraliobacillus zengyii TaxID=2213194 RepID=UPI000DD3A939|nr:ABC-2 transporter permease [Paraliobacillus zengyii]
MLFLRRLVSLWKKDFWLSMKLFLLSAFLIILVPSTLFLCFAIVFLVIQLFIDENHNKVNVFMKSLPIGHSLLVRSRYIYVFIEVVIFLSLYFLINGGQYKSSQTNIVLSVYDYKWVDIYTIFSLVLLIFVIIIPVLYLFSSKVMSNAILAIFGICFVFGMYKMDQLANQQFEFVRKEQIEQVTMKYFYDTIPLSPFVFFIVVVLLYLGSMFWSEQILKRKI